MSYCTFVNSLSKNEFNVHREYHDNQYGFPIDDDNELFGRLVLEINQAGLNWTIILNKQNSFRKAYHNFNIKKIASYKEKDVTRLLNDAGIIRNSLKINAAIENAKTVLALQKEFGSFHNWLRHHHPKSKDEWTKLFKKTFKFTGGEIVNEFLMSSGWLSNAHEESCPVYKKIFKKKPMWLKT
ncbi:MAG: DNA-3-methyladenine glycosylase I [Ignavibacteria bacterium]